MPLIRILTFSIIIFVCALLMNCGLTAQSAVKGNPLPVSGHGMRLIHAAGMSFQMGDSLYQNATPVRTVKFRYDFYIDSTEVTQADYYALMGVNPSYFTGDTLRPVERVTWFDAVLYCNARSRLFKLDTVYRYTLLYGNPGDGCYLLDNLAIDYAKNGYRLPTEAEWEYACRADAVAGHFSAIDTAGLNTSVWWIGNSRNGTHPVATRFPNAWGLYDMSGNIWEWCNDWYMKTYPSGSQTDPTGPSSGTSHVLRGGSWQSDANVRFWSFRYFNFPAPADDKKGRSRYGFRCVRRL